MWRGISREISGAFEPLNASLERIADIAERIESKLDDIATTTRHVAYGDAGRDQWIERALSRTVPATSNPTSQEE
jgi:hypothetical protein